MKHLHVSFLAVAGLVLSACSGGNDDAPPAGPVTPPVTPVTKYDLAGGCYAIKALANGKFVNAQLTAAANDAATAEPFRMQAAGLGRYVFYTHDGKFLTAGSTITAAAAPADGSDWTCDTTDDGHFVAESKSEGQKLTTDDSGKLVMGDTAGEFAFVPVAGCKQYPEMPTDIGETFTGPAAGDVIGYADIHAHMAMGSEMSDGSLHRGPSAGGVMYGHTVDRFGVIEALKDCESMHGPNGATTAEIVLDQAPDPHDTVGWPTFVDWPARDSMLHQQMYYKFVERSYKAGQRLMVLHATNIEALCDVAKKTSGDKNSDCTDMGVGLKQIAYAHDIQDYIDAQNGGPGKGWFRIASNPTEAEGFIRAGKMAVVPGLEFNNMFKCNVTYQGSNPGDESNEVVGCTTEMIDQQIEEAWDKGVRGIFLYHDVDSALGGTGIFSAALNLVGYYGTKGWWNTYSCDDADGKWVKGGAGLDNGYFYGAGTVPLSFSQGYPAAFLDNPLGAALVENAGGVLPLYPNSNQCNNRSMTKLGHYALEAAMKKGFVLDIDHAEIFIKQQMLDEGAKTEPAYPMISAHGGHGGFTNAQVLQMLKQGGIMYPGMVNGQGYTWFYNKVEAIWNQMSAAEKAKYPIAVGYGADQNGLAGQPGPRGGDSVVPVDYDNFTLFRGPGWSARLSALPAVKVGLLTVPEGNKHWNVDEVGVAHYGMVPDVVEQIRIESGGNTKYLDGFYNSAAAYLRLWKQTVAASAVRPAPVRPAAADLPQYVAHPIDPTTSSP